MADLTPTTFTVPDADGLAKTFKGYEDADGNILQPIPVAGRDGTLAKVDSQGRLKTASTSDFAFAIGAVTGASTSSTYSAGEQIGDVFTLDGILFDAGAGAFIGSALGAHVDDGTRLIDSLTLVVLAADLGTTDATPFAPPFAASSAVQLWLPLTKTIDLGSGAWNRWEATVPAGGLAFGGGSADAVGLLIGTTTSNFASASPDVSIAVATTRT